MKNFKCKKCNLEILNPNNRCQNCQSESVEYKYLEIFKNNVQLLEDHIENGFEIVGKIPVIEKFGEQDFHGFEYELQRPI